MPTYFKRVPGRLDVSRLPREPAPWSNEGKRAHAGIFPSPAQKAENARRREHQLAQEKVQKAKRERDAEDWIRSLRIGKAAGDACNRRSK